MYAQDYHYTQNYSLITLENAANVGNMDYDHIGRKYRAQVLYRNQWRSIQSPFVKSKTPFETYRACADGLFQIKKIHDHDFIGLGFNVLNEKSGDLGLSNVKSELAFSYNIRLDNSSFHYLSLGVAPTFTQRSFGFSNMTTDNQWNGREYDSSLPTGEVRFANTRRFADFNLGLIYRNTNVLKKFNYTVGLALFNVTEPNYNFVSENNLHQRVLIHNSGLYRLKPERNFYYYTYFWNQGELRELNTIMYKTIASASNSNSFTNLGLGFRFTGGLPQISNDALSVHFIQDFQNIRFALSYDLNISKLRNASNIRGGIELTLTYYGLNTDLHKKIPLKYNFGNTKCPKHMRPHKLDFD